MFRSIKTSEKNREVVAELTSKLGLGPENLIARIAFTYSISQGRKLQVSSIEDSKGKEYSSSVLFGDYLTVYTALICQHYCLHKLDYDIPKYVKMHVDDGLSLIYDVIQKNPNLSLFDFILDEIDRELENL